MISILVPFHREGVLVTRAIESVRAQTLTDWQLVLVANNADSETQRIVRAAVASDRRIEMCEEATPGIAHALNTGLKFCAGDYVARLDADDAMPPDRLLLQKEFLDSHAGVGLVSGRINFISTHAEGYDAYAQMINAWRSHEVMFKYRFVESPVAHPSVMFRRNLIENFGVYSTAAIPEDYELWLRWLTAGVRFAKIDEVVLDWYDSTGRLSRTHHNYTRRAFDQVRMDYLLKVLPSLARGRPLWICGGKYARKKATMLATKGLAVTGIVDLVTRTLSQLKCMTYSELPKPGEIFLLSMVSNRGGYAAVENLLVSKGYREGEDFLLAG